VPLVHFALLLQEAFRGGPAVPAPGDTAVPRAKVEQPPHGPRREIGALAERTGLHLFYVPSMRNGQLAEGPAGVAGPAEDRGSAILSTMPLDDLQVIELPFERQRRVALTATVAGTSGSGAPWRLRLADVQVDTSLAWTRGGPFAARKRQTEALLDALRLGGGGSGTPTIVGGDFNTWLGPKEPALDVMRRAFADGGARRDSSLTSSSTWQGPLGARAALDYVFVRGVDPGTGTRRLPGRFGSDHFPLLTVVDVAGTAAE
jgi:endonuclease/exonuclease/phosphatase family metal-dependent hydrolase